MKRSLKSDIRVAVDISGGGDIAQYMVIKEEEFACILVAFKFCERNAS
jgi:hypothetical protein